MATSSKTKYKNEIKLFFNELLCIAICIVCYYLEKWTSGLGTEHTAKRRSRKVEKLG